MMVLRFSIMMKWDLGIIAIRAKYKNLLTNRLPCDLLSMILHFKKDRTPRLKNSTKEDHIKITQ